VGQVEEEFQPLWKTEERRYLARRGQADKQGCDLSQSKTSTQVMNYFVYFFPLNLSFYEIFIFYNSNKNEEEKKKGKEGEKRKEKLEKKCFISRH